MSRLAALITWVCTALWFGAMMFLLAGVTRLFAEFPKQTSDVAVQAAPCLFATFEKYQLVLALIALVAAFGWYLATRARLVMILFILLALAAAGGAISTNFISAKMHALREAGRSGSPEFMRLHGRSMIVYTCQAALLLVAVIMLPFAPIAPPAPTRQTASATAPV